MNYLSKDGLTYLWSKIKSEVDAMIKKSQTRIQLTVPASSWSLEDNVYYASVLCSSVTSASMTGSFGILCSSIDTSSLTDKKTYLKQAGYIYSAEITTVGYVGFKAVKQPTLDIKVWITLEG